MVKITLGADPELFIRDKKTKEFVSAHDIAPGTKQNPYMLVPHIGGTVQADGTAVEFGIHPDNSPTQATDRLTTVMNEFERKYLEPQGLELVVTPCVVWPEKYFATLPQIATELGCEPDYNAYTGRQNVFPSTEDHPTLRTGGGHIHIGWMDREKVDPLDPDHFNDCRILTMNLDIAFDHYGIDKNRSDLRTKLYGTRGSFRPKPYGMEYRVPSNRWLISESVSDQMFRIAHKVLQYSLAHGLSEGKKIPDIPRFHEVESTKYRWNYMEPSRPEQAL